MKKPIQAGLLIAASLTLALPASGCTKKAEVIKIDSNIIVQSTKEDFNKGEWKNASITTSEDGEIQIKKSFGKYLKTALYTSAEIKAEPFTSVILSFNADTPEGTAIIIEEQMKVGEEWSPWQNFANWGTTVTRGSGNNTDEQKLAYIDVDAMTVKEKGTTGNAVRYRITLNTNDEKVTPSVRLLSFSFENEAKQASNNQNGNVIKLDKVLDVPVFSQMERDPEIANSICSPTSMAMVLKYYGLDILPEETAWGAFDNNALMFGNWVFNCAYAGSYGFDAYVAYLNSIEDIKKEIQKGSPVICSVKYKNDESTSGDLPVVHGAAIASTPGHLLVVCGFTEENGKEYVVVNDPAADKSEGVRLKYLADEFSNAWNRVSYIVHKAEGQRVESRRLTGTLEATGKTKQYVSYFKKEYIMKIDNKKVNIGDSEVRLIMATLDGKKFSYMNGDNGDSMWFTGREEKGVYKFLFITKKGITYTAELDWQG